MVAKYPAIPAPTAEVHALRSSSISIKETVEILSRQRGDPQHSAVTFEDLITMGIDYAFAGSNGGRG